MDYKYVWIAAGVIILLMIISKMLKKSPAKYYRKAKKFHKKGEKYYELGDDEIAQEYYDASRKMRQKAREMEEVKEDGMV